MMVPVGWVKFAAESGSLFGRNQQDLSAGEYRWLTVVSPEGPDDIELLLEPNSFPAAQTYQKALFEAGIPLTAFAVDDIQRA